MKTQHTPGPWSIHQTGSLTYEIMGNRPWGKGPIGLVTTQHVDPPGTDFANARLFAAAPELLTAAEDVANYLNANPKRHAILAALNAAIAKAKGL